ncbi:MAG: hypothetical protein KDB03_00095 [Planctomycetales bacterium]|nr:hypothetical protein [Planctomycetales bacterium]
MPLPLRSLLGGIVLTCFTMTVFADHGGGGGRAGRCQSSGNYSTQGQGNYTMADPGSTSYGNVNPNYSNALASYQMQQMYNQQMLAMRQQYMQLALANQQLQMQLMQSQNQLAQLAQRNAAADPPRVTAPGERKTLPAQRLVTKRDLPGAAVDKVVEQPKANETTVGKRVPLQNSKIMVMQ